MNIMSWCFQFIWNNFFTFMNWELSFGDVSFTLWQFLLGSIIVFAIVVGIIRRLFD